MLGWSGKDLARVTGKFHVMADSITKAMKAEGQDPTDIARNFYFTSGGKRP